MELRDEPLLFAEASRQLALNGEKTRFWILCVFVKTQPGASGVFFGFFFLHRSRICIDNGAFWRLGSFENPSRG